jgi:hypothetical protein
MDILLRPRRSVSAAVFFALPAAVSFTSGPIEQRAPQSPNIKREQRSGGVNQGRRALDAQRFLGLLYRAKFEPPSGGARS